MTNFDQLRRKCLQKDPFGLFWVFQTLFWARGNHLRNFEIHEIDYKVDLGIDSSEIFYEGDRMREGLSFEV